MSLKRVSGKFISLRADAKCVRPLGFGVMSHTEVKCFYCYKNEIGSQRAPKTVEQYSGLESDQLQTEGKAQSQPETRVRGLIEREPICNGLRGEWRRHSLWGPKNEQWAR